MGLIHFLPRGGWLRNQQWRHQAALPCTHRPRSRPHDEQTAGKIDSNLLFIIKTSVWELFSLFFLFTVDSLTLE